MEGERKRYRFPTRFEIAEKVEQRGAARSSSSSADKRTQSKDIRKAKDIAETLEH
jgi:hypothetical protein